MSKHLMIGIVSILALGSLGANCNNPGFSCPKGGACIVAEPVLASGHVSIDGCDEGLGGLGGDNLSASVGTGFVGWDNSTRGNRLGDRGRCDSAQYYYRTAMFFNQTVINDFVKKHGLLTATLRFTVPTNLQGQPVPGWSSFQRTCVASLGQASDQDWFGDDPANYHPTPFYDPIALPYQVQAPFSDGTTTLSHDATSGGVLEEVNVTPQVREWVIGRKNNNGFVLAGRDEPGVIADGACESKVEGMQLVLLPLSVE